MGKNRSIKRRTFLHACIGTSTAFLLRPNKEGKAEKTNLDIIDESLDALAKRQNADGSFGASSELFGRDPAVASLVGLALLSSGSLPGRGRFGACLSKIIDYLFSLSLQLNDANNSFKTKDRSYEQATLSYLSDNKLKAADIVGLVANFREKGQKPLYGHGFATLFLAEILGSTEIKEIRNVVQSALDLIIRTQNQEGGWRYFPQKSLVADVSVTVCQITALKACQNAGLYVPKETVERAAGYISSLQNADGGFRYMTVDGPSGYGRTAAAVHALQLCEVDSNNVINKGLKYLESIYPSNIGSSSANDVEYWGYSQFYASLVWQRFKSKNINNAKYETIRNSIVQEVIQRRSINGLWRSNISTEVETAFALCILLNSREGTPIFLY